jgi:hypothetical protein
MHDVELQSGCFKFKLIVWCFFFILEVPWEEKKMVYHCHSTKNKHSIFVCKFKQNERIRIFFINLNHKLYSIKLHVFNMQCQCGCSKKYELKHFMTLYEGYTSESPDNSKICSNKIEDLKQTSQSLQVLYFQAFCKFFRIEVIFKHNRKLLGGFLLFLSHRSYY